MPFSSSWLDISQDSPFSLANIPFGIISTSGNTTPRVAVAIGDFALDLEAFALSNGFSSLSPITQNLSVFSRSTLNDFAGLGQHKHRQVREYLRNVLSSNGPYREILQENDALQRKVLIPLKNVKLHLPMQIGDYTDFYGGRNHAFNVGVMFRGVDNALQPNYSHLPVGYHGRSSSVVVSGTPIQRPSGQILVPGSKVPVFSSSRKLDIELEMGAFICKENEMGNPINISAAKGYIFGLVLLNDWSARDIQAWEYVPLGPFLSKSFATTISPWVVLTCSLEPFLGPGLAPGDREELLPYLRESPATNVYHIALTVDLTTKTGNTTTIASTNAKNLLYSYPQMLAHHSVNGCPMRVGDLLGSGTISGESRGSLGSLLEQSLNGKKVVQLNGGEERLFLEDGDQITIRGECLGKEGQRVGFGECIGIIV